MKKIESLRADLYKVTFAVLELYRLEKDAEKKEHLNAIFSNLLEITEKLDLNADQSDKLMTRIWNQVRDSFIKYGVEELFEQVSDFL